MSKRDKRIYIKFLSVGCVYKDERRSFIENATDGFLYDMYAFNVTFKAE
jgi:hypothetical protein